MEKVFLIPREGIKVREPSSKLPMPAEGGYRSLNSYYNRRIADGDLIVRDAPAAQKPSRKPAAKKANPKKEDSDE